MPFVFGGEIFQQIQLIFLPNTSKYRETNDLASDSSKYSLPFALQFAKVLSLQKFSTYSTPKRLSGLTVDYGEYSKLIVESVDFHFDCGY